MSIKLSILLPTLTAVIIGVVLLTAVAGVYSSGTVTDLSNQLMERAVAQHSSELNGLLAEMYSIGAGAATVIAGYLPGENLRTFDDKRDLAVGILLDILKSNNHIAAMWTCWEPDAFDGMDFLRANQPLHDNTGRFIPITYKDAGSSGGGSEYKAAALTDYDDPLAGDFYQGALLSGKPHLTNPFVYSIDGRDMMVCSIAIPIIQNGKTLGAVGVFILVDELFQMVNTGSVFDDGYLFVISSDERYAAHTNENYRMTQYNHTWLNRYSDLVEGILNGRYYSFTVEAYSDIRGADVYFLGTSMTIADTGNYWVVGVTVPKSTIAAPSNRLLYMIVFISFVLVLTVGVIIYTVVHKNLKGLPAITSVAEQIALGGVVGTGDAVSADTTKNEIELLQRAFTKLTNVIKAMMGDLSHISNEILEKGDVDYLMDVNKYDGSYNKIAEGINELVHKFTAAIEIEKNASRYKSVFLANMSHEIKTPLTVISVYIQRVGDVLEDLNIKNELASQPLIKAQEEIMRLARVVESALRMAAMQESREKMQSIDAASLFTTNAEAYRSQIEKKGNELNVKLNKELPRIYGNADQLIQVLTNLLVNANKHTQNGKVSVHAQADSKFVSVYVTDTGTGIAPKMLPYIFERGISGSGGTGVGLSICKSIIETHDGTLKIESVQNKGTEVIFTIPIYCEGEAGEDNE
jgi:signal transduction histidine kinase